MSDAAETLRQSFMYIVAWDTEDARLAESEAHMALDALLAERDRLRRALVQIAEDTDYESWLIANEALTDQPSHPEEER